MVVGSGATGGWAAKRLTEAGWTVALLEAGPKITPKDFTEHTNPWQLTYLGQSPIISKGTADSGPVLRLPQNPISNGSSTILKIPATQDKPFYWIRQRVLGRTQQ